MESVSAWVDAHPWLADLACLHEAVEGVGSGIGAPRDPRTPEEIARGVPLLRSPALDRAVFAEAGKLVVALAEALVEAPLPPAMLEQSTGLCALLEENPLAGVRLVQSAAEEAAPPRSLGAFLAWKALARVVGGRESAQTGSSCPTCGALPAMAQLRESERGRERSLCCGLCGTRWKYARIGCPFCGSDTVERQGVLEPEDEKAFRIDFCRACNAYLKTYLGQGGESLALSDWSTLHLDAACAERGLRRGGPSLYDL